MNVAKNRTWSIVAGVAGAAAVGAGAWWLANRQSPVVIADDDGQGQDPDVGPGDAQFVVQLAILTDPVEVGEHARARITVTNTGDAAGSLIIDGETRQAGIRQGTWIGQIVTVAPGESTEVELASAGPIHEQFAGQVIEAVFTTDAGHQLAQTFRVAELVTIIKQVTFKHPDTPLPGDSRLLRVYFFRGGITIASWGRSWVSQVSNPFFEVGGNPVTITHLGRAGDELDGLFKSLPLQVDQVTVEVINLPDPSRQPWPTLKDLTVTLSDDAGRSLHKMVFNGVGPGQTATQTVNLG